MTQEAINNGKVLFELGVKKESVDYICKSFCNVTEMTGFMNNPVVSTESKWNAVDKIFNLVENKEPKLYSKELKNFIKVVIDHGQYDEIADIFEAYYDLYFETNNIKRVVVYFAKKEDEKELANIKKMLESKYTGYKLEINTKINEELLGGTLVVVGHEEYDYSYEGKLKQLERLISRR